MPVRPFPPHSSVCWKGITAPQRDQAALHSAQPTKSSVARLGRDATTPTPKMKSQRVTHLATGLPELFLCRSLFGVGLSHHLVGFLQQKEFQSTCCTPAHTANKAGDRSDTSHAPGKGTDIPATCSCAEPSLRISQRRLLVPEPGVHPISRSAAG